MEGSCIFVIFMIFNSIMGLTGIAVLAVGIYGMVTQYNHLLISLVVAGTYIITILILGACSWKKQGVLIAYFVLVLLLIILETTLAVLIFFYPEIAKDIHIDVEAKKFITICVIVFGASAGIALLSFIFSSIYFCIIRTRSDKRLYSDVRHLEYTNLPSI